MKTKKLKIGMTLVEVILAMAILGIVSMLMTPVMVSAYHQITLNGYRQSSGKDVAANMEDVIAGQAITETLSEINVTLPNGITVKGNEFNLQSGTGVLLVNLFGLHVPSMSLVQPTNGTSASIDPSASTESSPTTTLPAVDLKNVSVTVELWKISYKQGVIEGTSTAYDYKVLQGATVVQDWTSCSNGSTYITSMHSNANNYEIVVQQRSNPASNKHFNIRSAPVVSYTIDSVKQVVFFTVIDNATGVARRIKANDDIQLQLRPGAIWNLVTNNYEIKLSDLDVNTVYTRYSATSKDPASFPGRLA